MGKAQKQLRGVEKIEEGIRHGEQIDNLQLEKVLKKTQFFQEAETLKLTLRRYGCLKLQNDDKATRKFTQPTREYLGQFLKAKNMEVKVKVNIVQTKKKK